MINRKRVLRYLPNNYASLIFSDKKEVLKQILIEHLTFKKSKS